MPLQREDLLQLKMRMNAIPWYHEIDLGPELGITPGVCKNDEIRLLYMNLPENLTNWHVVDIGSWDGYFAFAAERRGAHVLATDIWGDYEIKGLGQINTGEGIKFAAEVLGSQIKMLYTSVYDLATAIWDSDTEYMADLVIFPGVLYHLTNPMAALEQIYKILVPDGLLIVETHLDLLAIKRPVMALYRADECNHDETNRCGPNPAAVEALLEWSGFRDIRFQGGIGLDQTPDPQTISYARAAWHARK